MREKEPLERKERRMIEIETSNKIKLILNLLDNMIAGKRFGELDSAKQMYLLDCQAKIEDMQQGYFTEDSMLFLYESVLSLINTLNKAKVEIEELGKYIDKECENNDC